MKNNWKVVFGSLQLICFLSMVSCKTTKPVSLTVTGPREHHSNYDDTSLAINNSSVLMPYNRFIDPAGIVIRFGNGVLENHSLDCVLLPGDKVLAVEDRYGVAFIDVQNKKLLYHLDYTGTTQGLMSTYSGIKFFVDEGAAVHILWGAANPTSKSSLVLDAIWDGEKAKISTTYTFPAVAPAPMSLPNDIAIAKEGQDNYLYVVLNGNNQLTKIRMKDKKAIWTVATGMAPFGISIVSQKAYVTNWAGEVPVGNNETAGIPYAKVYIDPRTGATSSGTVSVFDINSGNKITDINVGLHPNAIIKSPDNNFLFVTNGNSDNVSVINSVIDKVVETISVSAEQGGTNYIGHSPNAMAIDKTGTTLYVSNGMDNAVAVIKLSNTSSHSSGRTSDILGFIPTEAYPAGLVLTNTELYVANLEGEGARAATKNNFSIHQQEAAVSLIPLPDANTLKAYTDRVNNSNLVFRTKLSQLLPRPGVAPKPVPERIGEPSVFKHVVYIIKENKTYDQVLGDMPEGNGMKLLCIFGNDVTPNQHKLAKDFLLLDNFYASGKSSAEGHSWSTAAIVTDYVEKNVRAWFRSYPHVLADALVYNKEGFLWNNALDHGKSVKIYGEACEPQFKSSLDWTGIYQSYVQNKPFEFKNTTTISRVRPIMSETYPCYDGQKINDQIRADVFVKELNDYEKMPGDQLPQLMILALPADHTAGTREGYPTPRAMVADNDLALGKIIEALTKSRFWESTVVFVTEDDSQSGWDHISAYRTTGFVISPYSQLQRTVHTNYNQTCIVRTIEQILGIPPMNIMDATALPMFDCFSATPAKTPYAHLKNIIPLNEMNKSAASLTGKARAFALLSASKQFDHIDGGSDDLLNRILWFSANGKKPYPKQMILSKKERKDADD
ncbi:MAG: beta-propeller fold lactonase family protein [Chitinophagaceae bacterium]|nr:beta-propeller fold lactonase family protein [Chitinophagaceae bacterium]